MPRTTNYNWRDHVESTAIQPVQCESVLPVDSESKRNPLVFNVRSSPGLVVDAKNIKLLFTINCQKLVDDAWVGLEINDLVALYNNFGFSAFEDVQLFLGGTLCETSMREYTRSSYLRNFLFTSKQEQRALESAMFLKDNSFYVNHVLSDDKNPGGRVRRLIIQEEKSVVLYTPVNLDILQSGAYIPDNTGFTLKFYPAKSDKCLQQTMTSSGTPPTRSFIQVKMTITHAELHVPRCHLSSIPKSVTTDFECCKVFNYVSPKEMKSFSCSLNSEMIPSKMAIVILSEDRYEGTKGKSGIVFNHHKVSNITIKSNGRVLPTLGGMNMDPEKKNWSEAYDSIFSQLNAINPNLQLSTFDNGNAIYGVNLQPEKQNDKSMKSMRGTCDVNITFQEAPTTNVVILMFCYFQSRFLLDRNGVFVSEINPKL